MLNCEFAIYNKLGVKEYEMSGWLNQVGPIALILIGAVLSAVGAIWAQIQSDRQQNEIIRLNEHVTEAVTGGDSHPIVSPVFWARPNEQGDIRTLHLRHSGKYPVYDLVVRVTDVTKLRELSARGGHYSMDQYMWRFHIGTIGRGYEDMLMKIPNPEASRMEFSFTFLARSGQFEQRSIYQKVKGVWYTVSKLQKDGKVLYEHKDKGAPEHLLNELAKPLL